MANTAGRNDGNFIIRPFTDETPMGQFVQPLLKPGNNQKTIQLDICAGCRDNKHSGLLDVMMFMCLFHTRTTLRIRTFLYTQRFLLSEYSDKFAKISLQRQCYDTNIWRIQGARKKEKTFKSVWICLHKDKDQRAVKEHQEWGRKSMKKCILRFWLKTFFHQREHWK